MNTYQSSDLTPLIIANSNLVKEKCPVTSDLLIKACLILTKRINDSKENIRVRVNKDDILTNNLLPYIPICWSIQTVIDELFNEYRTRLDSCKQYYFDEILFNSMIHSIFSDMAVITYAICYRENKIEEKLLGKLIDGEKIGITLVRNYFKASQENEIQASHKFSKKITEEMQAAIKNKDSQLHDKAVIYVEIIQSCISEMVSLTPNKGLLTKNFDMLGLIYSIFSCTKN